MDSRSESDDSGDCGHTRVVTMRHESRRVKDRYNNHCHQPPPRKDRDIPRRRRRARTSIFRAKSRARVVNPGSPLHGSPVAFLFLRFLSISRCSPLSSFKWFPHIAYLMHKILLLYIMRCISLPPMLKVPAHYFTLLFIPSLLPQRA